MDKRYLLAFGMGAASLALGILVVRMLGLGPAIPAGEPEPFRVDLPSRTENLSGPYTHKNLTVYLVHGKNKWTGKTLLTLEEAMFRKLVIVHETSEVNELEIENISRTEEVYVQAGDIVKGGKQDRVLAVDLIVPANSGRMPISSFCVEHGRWTARGEEATAEFNSSADMAPTKELKLAAKVSRSQAQVWESVANTQSNLSTAANVNVQSNSSRSSLQLSLENSHVRANSNEYINALRSIIAGKDDVIGFVFAINGVINSADTYGSGDLFVKLWPRLLKAAAIEAVSASYDSRDSRDVSMADVEDFLENGEAARFSDERVVTDRIRVTTRESKDVVLVESLDSQNQSTWLHRNYLSR